MSQRALHRRRQLFLRRVAAVLVAKGGRGKSTDKPGVRAESDQPLAIEDATPAVVDAAAATAASSSANAAVDSMDLSVGVATHVGEGGAQATLKASPEPLDPKKLKECSRLGVGGTALTITDGEHKGPAKFYGSNDDGTVMVLVKGHGRKWFAVQVQLAQVRLRRG